MDLLVLDCGSGSLTGSYRSKISMRFLMDEGGYDTFRRACVFIWYLLCLKWSDALVDLDSGVNV